jgi:hypothetical protein
LFSTISIINADRHDCVGPACVLTMCANKSAKVDAYELIDPI